MVHDSQIVFTKVTEARKEGRGGRERGKEGTEVNYLLKNRKENSKDP